MNEDREKEGKMDNAGDLEKLAAMQSGDGTYCCACCYTWYRTREEKDKCMEGHGDTVLNVTLKPEAVWPNQG